MRKIEEYSMNALPSLSSYCYDGWVLRIANGYTRRANSIYPIYPSEIEVEEKINFCEKLYENLDIKLIFKMTENVFPENLDEVLKKRNFEFQAETSVQVLDISKTELNFTEDTLFSENISLLELNIFFRLNEVDKRYKETLQKILNLINFPKCFAFIENKGEPVACGLGVVEENYVGIFDIVVDKKYRRQGLGKRIIKSILKWSKGKGANYSYLQVMKDNPIALDLYKKIGYRELYRYWYRVRQ